MTKTINVSRISYISVLGLCALLFALTAITQTAHAAITTQLDLGSRSSDVTQLQQFVAADPTVYPEGLVTGYFGPLTQAAVVQYQIAYDIPQAGRVGPMTQASINNVMSSGFALDTHAPIMANLSLQANRNNAVISWTTNDSAKGQVNYDVSPIRSNEESGRDRMAYVSGTAVSNDTGARNSQSLTIQGLQPNTLYYYLVRSIDNSGNLTMTLPNFFRTNQ